MSIQLNKYLLYIYYVQDTCQVLSIQRLNKSYFLPLIMKTF